MDPFKRLCLQTEVQVRVRDFGKTVFYKRLFHVHSWSPAQYTDCKLVHVYRELSGNRSHYLVRELPNFINNRVYGPASFTTSGKRYNTVGAHVVTASHDGPEVVRLTHVKIQTERNLFLCYICKKSFGHQN